MLVCALIWLLLPALAGARQEPPVRLPCVADTNVSSFPSEQDLNYGASSRFRLKGHEMIGLARFETSPIQGWTIERAVLRLHPAGPVMLRTLGISTVAVAWTEGTGAGAASNDGATFLWADHGKRRWGGRLSDFSDAALTEADTRVDYTDVHSAADGWLEADIAPDIIYAMADGRSFGMAIVDEKGQTRANNDIHSREQSGFAPYLLIWGKPANRKPVKSTARAAASLPVAPVASIDPVHAITWASHPLQARSGLTIWAYGECEKVDAATGALLEAAAAPRENSSVWDGAAVHLAAARNEFTAFQLCIEPSSLPAEYQIQSKRLTGPNGFQISPSLFRDWYVKDGGWYPEVAIPLDSPLKIPDPRNAIPGQKNQSVFVDIYVPHEAPAGRYEGSIEVRTGAAGRTIPVELIVHSFALPDDLTFDVDLNAYGPPGDADAELTFHRMAHAHRTTLNILGYSQRGVADPDYVPLLAGSGKEMRISDWSAFDRRFGRYFDGSAFADMPRKGIPLKHAYLPFCEGWPSDIRQHYDYTPTTTAYPDIIAEHAMRAKPIEQAFDQTFKDEFSAVAAQFAAHIRERAWKRTEFQFYLNDKYFYKDPQQGGRGSSWWLLDEPMNRDDWLALRFFGSLFKTAVKSQPGLLFRADVSRPQWQRNWLDGLVDLMCVSGEFFTKNERCMEMKRKQGIRFWHYGTGNEIRDSNLTEEAWALKAYLAGADGILPWNSLGPDESFDRPTPTTILYNGGRFGISGPLASLRLKAFRRGQQDVEYLNLLARKKAWTREQVALAVSGLLSLDGKTRTKFVDDAGQPVFDRLSSEQFANLRASVAHELEK